MLTVGALFLVCLCPANGAEPEPWKGNKIGISDVPPPPFTAVTVKMSGNTARFGCWGRTYTLANTGLPVQIRSKDADLLAAPVRLVTESEGAPVEWKSTGVKLVKSTQAQVVLEGTAQSRIGTLDWKCTAEYDGLLRYDLEIAPSPGATVDKLELVFRVKPEHAPLMWLPGQYPVERHGRLRPQSGQANWYTWLGDMDRGLAVFYETEEAWDDPTRGDAWRLQQLPNSVAHAWTFIMGSKALPSPWKYTFGIMATPVKQTPGGRKWAWSGTRPTQANNFISREYFPVSLKHFGYPEATDDSFRQEVAGTYEMVCPYILLNLISGGAPEFAAHPEWKTSDPLPIYPWDAGDAAVKAHGDDLWEILPTQDYIDWIVWKCDQFVRANDLDGMYHDFTMLMVLTDIPHDFGYMRDGKPVRCYPFFERRELYKRIFTMLKQYKPDAINIGHMSGDMYVPLLTFCDIILNGEHFGGTYWNNTDIFPEGGTYPELMTEDYLNTEIMGHNYGLTSGFLEVWGNRGTTPPEKIWTHDRFLSGLSLLYDFSLWRPTAVSGSAYKAFSEFGAMDAEFVPFWHLEDIVRGQTDEVRCSAYRKKDGGSMLVFFNRGKEAREMTFTIDWAKLKAPGPGPVIARDALPAGWGELVDNELPVKGDTLAIEVPAEDFRLVAVE